MNFKYNGIVGILVNSNKDTEFYYTKVIISNILKFGLRVKLFATFLSHFDVSPYLVDSEQQLFSQSDLIITLGGDGTFLKSAKLSYKFQKPIIGFNLGNVGFLTEVNVGDIEEAISSLIHGIYQIHNKIVLKCEVHRKGLRIFEDQAVNDIVISKASLSRMLDIFVYLDEEKMDCFRGDGIIIATPIGSTGYSLLKRPATTCGRPLR